MDRSEQLKRSLQQQITKTTLLPVSAVVTAVRDEECDVQLDNKLSLTSIRLNAGVDGNHNKYTIYPAIGSRVLLTSISGGLDSLVVIKVNEVNKIKWQTDKGLFQLDENGIRVKNNSEELATLIDELVQAILDMVFTTNQGPTIQMVNSPTFIDLKNRFKTILHAG